MFLIRIFQINPFPSSADASWMLTGWFTPELAVDDALDLEVSSKES